MAPDTVNSSYFDTPARSERQQLLLHLLRNVGEAIYLRGPAGAGKTTIAERLLGELEQEFATVWLSARTTSDLAAATADQLGLTAGEAAGRWPDAVLFALGERELLLIIDDADELDLAALEQLAALHARGGRLLLIGRGGLAQAEGNWDLQFVDLPGFDGEQTAAFLRDRAGEQADRVTDDMAAALYRATRGMPGPLRDALDEISARADLKPVSRTTATSGGRSLWPWLAGGLAFVVLAGALVFQERINALFEPPRVATAVPPAPQPVDPTVEQRGLAPIARDVPAVDGSPVADGPGITEVVPPISLPQLSRAADDADAVAAAPQVDETAPPTETARTSRQPAASDPLEAVMRDALEAAEATRTEGAEAAPPPATAGVAEADRTAPPATGPDTAAEAPPAPITAPPAPITAAPAPVVAGAGKDVPVRAAEPSVGAPQAEKAAQPQAAGPAPVVDKGQSAQAPAPASVPAPVVERSLPSPVSRAPEVKPQAVEAAGPGAAVAKDDGAQWLRSRSPRHYTLQLVGARDRAAVEKFIKDNGIRPPYAIFERPLKGRPWYSLVAGDYADRDAAISARERLPKPLAGAGVWPRTFESIQKTK